MRLIGRPFGAEGPAPRGRRLVVAGAVLAGAAVLLVVLRVVLGAGQDQVSQAAPAGYDPPRTFAASGVALPQRADADPLPIVLVGLDAVVALPEGIEVIDTRTGQVRTRVPAAPGAASAAPAPAAEAGASGTQVTGTQVTGIEVTGTQPSVPRVVPVGGAPAVAVTFLVSVPGHGTTLGHQGVEVLAVDAAGYAPVARARVDLPVSLNGGPGLRSAQVIGEDGGLLVLVARQGADAVPTTYAVDPRTGRLAWQLDGFDAAEVVAHQVVGALAASSGAGTPGFGATVQVAAVHAGDGTPAWTARGGAVRSASVWAAGPSLLAALTTDAVTGARVLATLDARTGTVQDSQATDGGVVCRYDEQSVAVCARSASGQAWAAGFDATTGRRLWQLPDPAAGRVAPVVSAVWHGVVYGETANGPVAIDARTGADLPVPPGAAPALVNGYVGIVPATLTTPHPVAYRATS